MEGHYESLAQKVYGQDLICIQDTSTYMYGHHSGILREGTLGRIYDDEHVGVVVHPMLVLDAKDEFAYGFSSLEIVNRVGQTQNRYQREYKKLNIEEKESYRWIQAILNTQRLLHEARSLTIVADRESDIYQLWSRIPNEKTHLVIRTSLTRIFTNEHGEKVDPVQTAKRVGLIKLSIPTDSERKKKHEKHTSNYLYKKHGHGNHRA